jgi:hypothetical protein
MKYLNNNTIILKLNSTTKIYGILSLKDNNFLISLNNNLIYFVEINPQNLSLVREFVAI